MFFSSGGRVRDSLHNYSLSKDLLRNTGGSQPLLQPLCLAGVFERMHNQVNQFVGMTSFVFFKVLSQTHFKEQTFRAIMAHLPGIDVGTYAKIPMDP